MDFFIDLNGLLSDSCSGVVLNGFVALARYGVASASAPAPIARGPVRGGNLPNPILLTQCPLHQYVSYMNITGFDDSPDFLVRVNGGPIDSTCANFDYKIPVLNPGVGVNLTLVANDGSHNYVCNGLDGVCIDNFKSGASFCGVGVDGLHVDPDCGVHTKMKCGVYTNISDGSQYYSCTIPSPSPHRECLSGSCVVNTTSGSVCSAAGSNVTVSTDVFGVDSSITCSSSNTWCPQYFRYDSTQNRCIPTYASYCAVDGCPAVESFELCRKCYYSTANGYVGTSDVISSNARAANLNCPSVSECKSYRNSLLSTDSCVKKKSSSGLSKVSQVCGLMTNFPYPIYTYKDVLTK